MRVAVLGLGFMGSTHVRALQSLAGAQLAAVFSHDPAKLAGDLTSIRGNLGGAGQHFDFSHVAKYSDIDLLLADATLDAVDLCLPTHLHAPVAIAALRAGKHVLVEKPLALDAHEAAAMIEEATRQRRILMSAQVLRFFPEYQALRALVHSGGLGSIRNSVFRRRCAAPAWSGWLAKPELSGGGVFDLLIHDVDMCLHLFGQPLSATASGYEDLSRGVDQVTALLQYPSMTVTIMGGWHNQSAYPFSMGYTVSGDAGTVEFDSAGSPPTRYAAGQEAQLLPLGSHDPYAAEIEYFMECCRTGEPPVRCPPEESAAAVSLMHRIMETRRETRKKNGERLSC